MSSSDAETLLPPYRVLDLTDMRGHLCGKLLGGMGTDVVKIEPPGGDPARDLGPFIDDIPDRNRSLYWFAYNGSKRGITLNLESADGRALLHRLVEKADFLIESFKPGYRDSLELGYEALRRIKPDLIMTSITPFGQAGPYRDYEGSDLILMALGGFMAENGNPELPPVRISVDQAYNHGGAYGAAASLTAHYRRAISGEGQHRDISIQECLTSMFDPAIQDWFMGTSQNPTRRGKVTPRRYPSGRGVWSCKDGYVIYRFITGFTGRRTYVIFEWAEEQGQDTGGLSSTRFAEVEMASVSPEEARRWDQILLKLFGDLTKEELLAGAFKRHMMIYPVNTMSDLLEAPQLAAREYFVQIDHPELGRSVTYPGPWWKSPDCPWMARGRAPLIGEHNRDIYVDELGLSPGEVATLKEADVI